MRRQRSLSLSVQLDQRCPVSERHAQSSHSRVQVPVVSQETAGLEGVEVVEAELAVEVAVGGEFDGGNLAGELVRYGVELAKRWTVLTWEL